MSPYSIPLCTISTKRPAPEGPTCAYPSSGARAVKTGSSRFTGSSSPPAMRQKPTFSPQIPPDTPTSTKWTPLASASPCRRCESRKFELPPSMMTSPFSAMPSSCWNASSVIFPAGIISQNARGASSCVFSSSSEDAVRLSTAGSYVMTSCPCWRSRSVIPLPMRPSPIIPSCISSALLEMDARDTAAALLQGFIVAGRLCANEPAEAERLPRDRELLAAVIDDLEEEARVRAALVQLSGGVEVPRPVAMRDDAAGARAKLAGDLRDAAVVRLRGWHERLHAGVVTLASLGDQRIDRAFILERRVLTRRKHLVRLVLRCLHVRLVERVDLEPPRRDGHRELPAEEFAAKVGRPGEVGDRPLPVASVRGLARRGDEPLAVLAGRLCDQLLGPEAEAALGVGDADLVPAP